MQLPESEIGYILKGFPRTSETFISNEIYLLEQAGLKISIFSLKKLEGQKVHGVSRRINAAVTYLPEPSAYQNAGLIRWIFDNITLFSRSHLRLFSMKPWVYAGTLFSVVSMSFKYADGSFKTAFRSFLKEFLQAGYIAVEVLNSGRIRHLHAHFCHTATTVAMFAAKLSEVPFSFTAHAKDIYRTDMNPGDLLSRKLQRAEFAVTCTKANYDYLDRLKPATSRLYRIYHGIDLKLFTSSNNNRSSGPPLILSVGRFVEKKGFTYLVEACRFLKDEGVSFICRMIGGFDAYAETVQASIDSLDLADIVTIHHAVTQEELKSIYQTAAIFVLPCRITDDGDRDGIPNVLVEAMAMGLPVISTNISGIPELIKDQENGLLVPQKDPRALADAIQSMLGNPDLMKEFALKGLETVHRDFDAKSNTLALKQLFEQCLESARK